MGPAFVVSLLVGLAACEIRGVSPENQGLYSPNKNGRWACLSDPTIELSLDQINDDFCDCPDGSDEPGTNACPYTAAHPQYFYCENKGHKPAYIENFKLNDGVCDYDICCDGSDEYLSGDCPNMCAEVAKQLAAHVKKTKKHLSSALEIKKRLEASARDARSELESKVSAAVQQVAQGEKHLEELMKQQQENTHADSAGESLAREVSNHMRLLQEKASALAQVSAEKDQQILVLEGFLGDLLQNYNPNFNDLAVKKAVNSYADYASNKVVKEDILVDDNKNNIDSILDKIKSLGGSQGTVVENGSLKSLMAYYYAKVVAPSPKTTKTAVQSSGADSEQIKALRQKLESLKSEENIYREDLGANYGQNDILRSVQGSWINKKLGEYNYRLGFLDSIYQDNTLVGRFLGYDGNVMHYGHGSKCWNGPQRSAKIEMQCGVSNDLISVSEPEKCHYRFLITTPLACEELTNEAIEEGFKVDLNFGG